MRGGFARSNEMYLLVVVDDFSVVGAGRKLWGCASDTTKLRICFR